MIFPNGTPVGHCSVLQRSITRRYVPACSQKVQNAGPTACSLNCAEKAQQPRLVRLAEAAVHYAVRKAVLHQCQRTGLDEPTGLCFYLQEQFSNLVFCFRRTYFFSKLMPSCLIWKAMAQILIMKMQFAKTQQASFKNSEEKENHLGCCPYCFSDRNRVQWKPMTVWYHAIRQVLHKEQQKNRSIKT